MNFPWQRGKVAKAISIFESKYLQRAIFFFDPKKEEGKNELFLNQCNEFNHENSPILKPTVLQIKTSHPQSQLHEEGTKTNKKITFLIIRYLKFSSKFITSLTNLNWRWLEIKVYKGFPI